jgi:hypothetical protein
MTKAAIQEQVDIIRAATQNATRSKEAAQKFLVDAGIIKDETKDAKKKRSNCLIINHFKLLGTTAATKTFQSSRSSFLRYHTRRVPGR